MVCFSVWLVYVVAFIEATAGIPPLMAFANANLARRAFLLLAFAGENRNEVQLPLVGDMIETIVEHAKSTNVNQTLDILEGLKTECDNIITQVRLKQDFLRKVGFKVAHEFDSLIFDAKANKAVFESLERRWNLLSLSRDTTVVELEQSVMKLMRFLKIERIEFQHKCDSKTHEIAKLLIDFAMKRLQMMPHFIGIVSQKMGEKKRWMDNAEQYFKEKEEELQKCRDLRPSQTFVAVQNLMDAVNQWVQGSLPLEMSELEQYLQDLFFDKDRNFWR